MIRFRLPIAGAALLLLGGCYFQASTDLIGEHALKMEDSDSLVVIGGEIYRLDEHGSGYVDICQITRKEDRPGRCETEFQMKFERTSRGNYLAQFGNEYFALITREPGKDEGCFYLLGAALGMEPGDWTPLNTLEARVLKAIPKEVGSRQDLMKIVDLYETSILPRDPNCPYNHMIISDPRAFRVEGDPRTP